MFWKSTKYCELSVAKQKIINWIPENEFISIFHLGIIHIMEYVYLNHTVENLSVDQAQNILIHANWLDI